MLLLILLFTVLAACAPLSKHDSVLGDIGEVAGRTLLCPITLCLSEVGFYNNWQNEQKGAAYNGWYQSLSPERQAAEDQRQHEREIAAMQALGMMNSGRGPLGSGYAPPPPIYRRAPMPAYNPPPTEYRKGTNCTSTLNGNQVYTNCY